MGTINHSAKATTQDLFEAAFNNAMDHIIITDPEGIILFANTSASKTTGYSLEEMRGQTPRLWGKQMSKEFYIKMWDQIKVKLQPFHGEVKNKRKNGELYFAKVIISPIIHDNNLVGFIGTEEDISLQKKEEDTIRNKVEELERMNKLMVGRELKMAEMKKEIETLIKSK